MSSFQTFVFIFSLFPQIFKTKKNQRLFSDYLDLNIEDVK